MKAYSEVARGVNEYMFYHASEKLAKEIFPEVAAGQVILLKDFDEKIAILKEKLTKEVFSKFLDEHILPTVSEITQKVIELVFKPNGKKAIFLFRSAESKDAKTQEEEFHKVAADMKKEYVFVVTDVKEGWGKRVADYFALEEASLPVLELLEMKDDISRFKHTGELTHAAIMKFIEDCKKGAIPRFLKSEPIPAENSGPVFKVVGKNFKKEILENDFDILVKFYAPWCGHCKKLAPIYQALAEALSSNKKLKLYEVDVTKNDIEGHNIEGLPTIKFFPGKDKSNVINYSGERTEDEIAKFLKEKCSHPIEIPEYKAKDEKEKGKDDL